MQNFKNANKKSGPMVVGFILLGIGCLLLLKTLDLMFLPGWLFSFPVFLIGIGVIIGLRKGFNRPGATILIFLGTVFLALRELPDNSDKFIWPLVIIAIGIWIIFKPSKYFGKKQVEEWDKRVDQSEPTATSGKEDFFFQKCISHQCDPVM